MAWITPKEDWNSSDGVDFNDYNRLEGNTALLPRGKANISISKYDNDSAPDVKAGSRFDNNDVLIDITGDATPTGYAGITVSTTFYLYWDESGSSFIYSETVPTWSDALQGWYKDRKSVV